MSKTKILVTSNDHKEAEVELVGERLSIMACFAGLIKHMLTIGITKGEIEFAVKIAFGEDADKLSEEIAKKVAKEITKSDDFLKDFLKGGM